MGSWSWIWKSEYHEGPPCPLPCGSSPTFRPKECAQILCAAPNLLGLHRLPPFKVIYLNPTGVFIFFLVHFSKLISLVKNSHIFLISCSSQETDFHCEELSRLPGLRELNSGHPWWHLHILDQSGKALSTSLSLKTLLYLRLMASRPRRQRPTWACWTPPICSPTPSSCSSVDLLLRGWTCATSWAWGWYSGFKRYYSLDEQ